MVQAKTEEEYDFEIITICYACPLQQDNYNCPLNGVRDKSFIEKIEWFKGLSLSAKQKICRYHSVCSSISKKTAIPGSRQFNQLK